MERGGGGESVLSSGTCCPTLLSVRFLFSVCNFIFELITTVHVDYISSIDQLFIGKLLFRAALLAIF